MSKFTIIVHRGGEFVREKIMFYRCGVQTTVYDQDRKTWGVSNVLKLVLYWGYKINEFRIWRKFKGVDECYFEVSKDDRALNVATFAIGNNTKDIYMLSII